MTYCKKVSFVTVDEQCYLQRVDNFLHVYLKGLPKTRIYRLIRKGEVRVNKKRIKPDYKLQIGDQIRIPPVRLNSQKTPALSKHLDRVQQLNDCILYEDDAILVIDKPAGMAVHGGSGLQFGLIDALRTLRPQVRFMELVHRLDRDTSGCLMIAKKRSALRQMHEDLRHRRIQKSYQALVLGVWPSGCVQVNEPLYKMTLASGERIVRPDHVQGKPSETKFRILKKFSGFTLVQAKPVTGRTHQIRVHCQFVGCPIIGDEKYSRRNDARIPESLNVSRLFLHSDELSFQHPLEREKKVTVQSGLNPELEEILITLSK